jgi:23S rRNA-/tRNA-specific pseudouridylate synthase
MTGTAVSRHILNLSNRYLLHSYKVSFIHPITGKKLDIVSKIPEDFILR